MSANLMPFGGGAEQPAPEVVGRYTVVNASGGQPAPELVVVVLQAEQQHARAFEDVLASERAPCGEREVLERPQRCLARGARRQQAGQEAEQPFAR
nr:hypothetical protein [Bradyrhizobium liaoningense]